jgi:RNA polymerase sigma-70 factor (ECF subfamily)
MLSDEPTIELVTRARAGDAGAVEAILQRCLPKLKRWAHGRLPATARRGLDTSDLVHDVAIHVLRRLHHFEARHVGAMQAYLRRSVINRIRDEVRRIGRRPEIAELPEDLPSADASPLERTIKAETYRRYRDGLSRLRHRDRQLVIARIDLQWTSTEIAAHFGFSSLDTANRVVARAVQRLKCVL